MNLYLDASALVKRYIDEDGSDVVCGAMESAPGCFIGRFGFVEIFRALSLAAGRVPARAFTKEWPALGIVEVRQPIIVRAGRLAVIRELRSLDSLHLSAALALPNSDLVFATWDRRLGAAAVAEGLAVLPESA